MIEGKHSWKGLVSMKQRLYKISDESAFQRVLATLQENISFNSDTLLTVELFGISILKERLSPDFFQTRQQTCLDDNVFINV
jgi:acetone carboxylase gamma subunit